MQDKPNQKTKINSLENKLSGIDAEWDYITKTATSQDEFKKLRDIAAFHAFNPNGLVARKRNNDSELADLVNEGKLKSGSLIAYGTFNTYCTDQVMKMATARRVARIKLSVALDMLREDIEQQEKVIKEAK